MIQAGLILVLTLAVTACAGTSLTVTEPPPAIKQNENGLPLIAGNWRSTEPEMVAIGRYATTEYRLTLSRWEKIFTLALDKDMKKVIYIMRAEGSYQIQGANGTAGAFGINFRNDRKHLIIRGDSQALLKEYKFNACDIVVGKEKNISSQGCGVIGKVSECAEEYDLVKTENGLLYFGLRPLHKSFCTSEERPAETGPIGLRRLI